MMITLAAMMLLALLILRVNRGFSSTEIVLMESKFSVLGVSLANSIIEDATGKAFDENSDSGTVAALGDLSTLGPDDGEVWPNFDDFDDYKGLAYTDSSMPSARFNITCDVVYVDPTAPDYYSVSNTWHKKLTVKVTTPSSRDTIDMSTIFSYFYFR